jgi:peroxiredoxin Q/BCP
MNSSRAIVGAALVAALSAVGSVQAQTTQATTPPAPPSLEVGAVAPDFSLPGATRFGVLRDPVKLSDYKGKTVVLAFFFKARTKG